MSNLDYTFAVARIRALEAGLFGAAVIDQLMGCKTEEACLQVLQEKGWGGLDAPANNAEAMLKVETGKAWEVMKQLNVDLSAFDVLFYPHLFHNLKAAIKQVCVEEKNPYIFYDDATLSGEELMNIIRERNYCKLPQNMAKAAEEAYETLLHTRDGQMCDLIIDRATLDAIYEAGRSSQEPVVRQYAETAVALADIKIAVRCARIGKPLDFVQRAISPCGSFSAEGLARAAINGEDSVKTFLLTTEYADAVPALEESLSAFERWCDNRIIYTIKPQQYVSFSIGPLVAYVLARENEIKTVGIILSGKANGLSDESIRGRVREMYV